MVRWDPTRAHSTARCWNDCRRCKAPQAWCPRRGHPQHTAAPTGGPGDPRDTVPALTQEDEAQEPRGGRALLSLKPPVLQWPCTSLT